jgi:hypothetical protein
MTAHALAIIPVTLSQNILEFFIYFCYIFGKAGGSYNRGISLLLSQLSSHNIQILPSSSLS